MLLVIVRVNTGKYVCTAQFIQSATHAAPERNRSRQITTKQSLTMKILVGNWVKVMFRSFLSVVSVGDSNAEVSSLTLTQMPIARIKLWGLYVYCNYNSNPVYWPQFLQPGLNDIKVLLIPDPWANIVFCFFVFYLFKGLLNPNPGFLFFFFFYKF